MARSFTARITGDFTVALAQPAESEDLRNAIELDMSTLMQLPVTVTRIYEGSLVVEFYIDPVGLSPTNLTSVVAETVSILSTGDPRAWMNNTLTRAAASGVDVSTIQVSKVVDNASGNSGGCFTGAVLAAITTAVIAVWFI